MARTEKTAAIIIALFALIYLAGGRSLKLLEEFGPGPGFFPVILGLTLICLSVVYYFSVAKFAEPGRQSPFRPDYLLRPAGVMASLAVAALALDYLGFIITVFLLVLILLMVFERYRAIRGITLSLVISAGFYLLFDTWLRVPLPQGILKGLPF